jgi:hypothetical protein
MASKNNEKNRGDAAALRKKKVINFGENLLKHGFKRVVNGLKDQ